MRKFFLITLFFALIGCNGNRVEYGKYSIGRDASWFPLQLDQLSPTNLTAFTNALVQEIAKTEDVPLNVLDIGWSQLFQSLSEKKVAGIFTSISPTAITQDKYTFSDPFLLLGPVLIVPSSSTATSLEDLEGKIVAVNQFDDSVLIAERYCCVVIKLYQNKAMALEQLKNGEVDGVLMPVLDAESLVSNLYPSELKIVTQPLTNKAFRLITLKGSQGPLIKHFNLGLEKLRTSSKYNSLCKIYQV